MNKGKENVMFVMRNVSSMFGEDADLETFERILDELISEYGNTTVRITPQVFMQEITLAQKLAEKIGSETYSDEIDNDMELAGKYMTVMMIAQSSPMNILKARNDFKIDELVNKYL